MEHDVENLDRQGLVKETTVADLEHVPTRVVTLTKEGHKLLSRGKVLPREQATYHGLKKPKEVFHDTDLYRLYHKVSDEIEGRGGRVVRVQLDYEIKRELYRRLARACQDKSQDQEAHRRRLPAWLQGSEWVFPSKRTGMPPHPWSVQRRWLIRAGEKVGVGRLGWHAFRHSYSTLLNEYGTDAKVQQELLRHADIRTTMNIYTRAVPERLRKANRKVVRLLLPTGTSSRA
jgi:hypothetical protein